MPDFQAYPGEDPQVAQARIMRNLKMQLAGQTAGPMVGMPQQGAMNAPPQGAPGAMAGPAPVQSQAPTGQLPPQQPPPPAPGGNSLGMDNAALGAMLGTYGDQMELSDLDKQLAQAQALRDTALPEGRMYGKVYTAANPLEFIGAGIKQYKGAKREKELDEERKKKRKTIGENVAEYGKRVLGDGE